MCHLTQLVLAQAEGGGPGGALIDWWTLGAQVFNFLLLVVLLRVFLYKPVIRAMDRREKKIANHFEAAEQKRAEAEQAAADLQQQKDDLAAKRQGLLDEARGEADRLRKQLTDEARAEVDRQARRWQDELRRDREAFLQDLRRRTGEQVCAIARRALADLADTHLEQQMVATFVRRLSDAPEADRKGLAEAAGDGGIIVATAWELPEASRKVIAEAVSEHIPGNAELTFETAYELTCGLELRAGGHEISWTVDTYIQMLRDQLDEAIEDKTREHKPRRTGEADAAKESREQKENEGDDELNPHG